MPLDEVADAVGVIGAFGMDNAAGRQGVEQWLRCPTVGCLARRQEEGERLALGVGDGMDFRVAPASTDADCLGLRPPFPPVAER